MRACVTSGQWVIAIFIHVFNVIVQTSGKIPTNNTILTAATRIRTRISNVSVRRNSYVYIPRGKAVGIIISLKWNSEWGRTSRAIDESF